jgi:hypothetical protein
LARPVRVPDWLSSGVFPAQPSCVNDLGQFPGLLIMQRLLRPGTV